MGECDVTHGESNVDLSESVLEPTTLSTIAVQCGASRVVIALLKSRDWLELKIVEMKPSFTELGRSLADALDLERQHNLVLERLADKEMPISELMEQADTLISSQHHKADVYAAMAKSLGFAWADLNRQLQTKRRILQLSVQFHRQAENLDQTMSFAEAMFADVLTPNEIGQATEDLKKLDREKRGVLAASLSTLQSGKQLIDFLRQIGNDTSKDSRTNYLKDITNSACMYVEQYLERLHDRRQYLDCLYISRKALLDHCCSILHLYSSHAAVREKLQNLTSKLDRHRSLGDDIEEAERIQEQIHRLQDEIKEVQRDMLHVLRQADDLARASDNCAGEEPLKISYQLLDSCSPLVCQAENRCQLQKDTLQFFRLSDEAVEKLQETAADLDGLSSDFCSLKVLESIRTISQSCTELGNMVLDRAHSEGLNVKGVRDTLERLKYLCTTLTNSTKEIERSIGAEKEKETLLISELSELEKWTEQFVRKLKCKNEGMGTELKEVEIFRTDCCKNKQELELKLRRVSEIQQELESEMKRSGDRLDTVRDISQQLLSWQLILERREELASYLIGFLHELIEFDRESHTVSLSVDLATDHVTQINAIQGHLSNSQQHLVNLQHSGEQYILLAEKNSEDAKLSTVSSVEFVRQSLSRAVELVSTLEDRLKNIQTEMKDRERLINSWTNARQSVEQTLNAVVTRDKHIATHTPKGTADCVAMLTHCQHVSEQLMKHEQLTRQELNSADLKLEPFADEELIEQEFENIKTRLSSLKEKLPESSLDHHSFLQLIITFLKNVENIERSVLELCANSDSHTQLDTGEFSTREIMRLSGEELNGLGNSAASATFPECLKERYLEVLSRIHYSKLHEWQLALTVKRDSLIESGRISKEWQNIAKAVKSLEDQIGQILANIGGNLNETKVSIDRLKLIKTDGKKTSDRLEEFINCYSMQIGKLTPASPESPGNTDEGIFPPETLQEKLRELLKKIDETGHSLDSMTEFYTSVEMSEDWCQTGERLLVDIARQLADVDHPQAAAKLQDNINTFLREGIDDQSKRIEHMSLLLVQLQGLVAPRRVETVKQQTQDMVHTLRSIGRELQNKSDKVCLTGQPGGQLQVIDTGKTRRNTVERASQYDPIEKVDASVQPDFVEEVVQADVITPELCRMKPNIEVISDDELEGEDDTPYPPVFLNQLDVRHVTEGESVDFQVDVTGLPLPLVTWYHNGVCIDDGAIYSITYNNGHGLLRVNSARIEHQGRYCCTAENDLGSAKNETSLTIRPLDDGTKENKTESNEDQSDLDSVFISSESRDLSDGKQLLEAPSLYSPLLDVTVGSGENVKFQCRISGNPTPQVIWYHRGQPVQQIGRNHCLHIDGDTYMFTLKEVQTNDSGKVTVMALNAAGKIKSSCSLQVLDIDRTRGEERSKFSDSSQLVRARMGESACLIVKLPNLHNSAITWMKDGLVLNSDCDIKVERSDGEAVLRLQSVQEEHAGNYFCCTESSIGKIERSIQLIVMPSIGGNENKPVFVQPIDDAQCKAGHNVSFNCTIESSPPPKVEWLLNNKSLPPARSIVSCNENLHTLQLLDTVKMDSGKITCLARNIVGSNRSEASLSVNDDEEETYDNVERTPKTPTFNSVTDTRNAPSNSPTCSKKKEYQIIEESVITIQAIKEDHQVGAIEHAASEKQKSDECDQLTNQLVRKLVTSSVEETVDSKAARSIPAIPTQAPRFLSPIQGAVVKENDSFELEAVFTGRPTPSIEWTRGGRVVVPDSSTNLWHDSSRATLSVKLANTLHGGQYTCTLKNEAGTANSSAEVVVRKITLPPVFDRRLGGQTVVSGRRVHLDVSVSGLPAPYVRWLKDNTPVYSSSRVHIKQEESRHSLVIDCVNLEDGGQYTVEAKNSAGEAMSTAELKIENEQPKTDSIDGQFCFRSAESHHSPDISDCNYSRFVLLQHTQIVISLKNLDHSCLLQDSTNTHIAYGVAPNSNWKEIRNQKESKALKDRNLSKSVIRFFVRKTKNQTSRTESHKHHALDNIVKRNVRRRAESSRNTVAPDLKSGVSKEKVVPAMGSPTFKRNISLSDILSRNDELIQNDDALSGCRSKTQLNHCRKGSNNPCENSYNESRTESPLISKRKSQKENVDVCGDFDVEIDEISSESHSSPVEYCVNVVNKRRCCDYECPDKNAVLHLDGLDDDFNISNIAKTALPEEAFSAKTRAFQINSCRPNGLDDKVEPALDSTKYNVESNINSNIEVIASSEYNSHNMNHKIRLGQPFRLRCRPCCKDAANIVWYRNDQMIDYLQWPHFQQSQEPNGFLSLQCSSATQGHTGSYRCSVQCHHGNYSGHWYISVLDER